MSEANKQLVREFWSAMAAGDWTRMGEIYDENVVYHASGNEERRGRAAALTVARLYRSAFPDLQVNVEQLVAEGDFVVSRVNPRGTHSGEIMGVPATGRAVDVKWLMNMMRIRDGRIMEEWEVSDQADLARQIGLA